jgi:hypothetical protein
VGALSRLRRAYADDVAFLAVYVREAHPEDGWVLVENRDAGIALRDARTNGERAETAAACGTRLELDIPIVVDGVDDEVTRRYGGWPDRLYLVGADGRVAYQGGPGPFGFSVDELEAAIRHELGRPPRP